MKRGTGMEARVVCAALPTAGSSRITAIAVSVMLQAHVKFLFMRVLMIALLMDLLPGSSRTKDD